jgi:hypothetical protein
VNGVSPGRIVFIDEVPLSQRLYDRYGIGILRDAGFDVEIWDCIPFLVPRLAAVPVADPLCFDGIRHIESGREARARIEREPATTVFVVDIGYRLESWRLFRELSRGGRLFGIQLFDAQPPGPIGRKEKTARWVNTLFRSPLQAAATLFRRLPPASVGIGAPAFVLSGGRQSVDPFRYPFPEPRARVRAHALDYDTFLREASERSGEGEPKTSPYAVFLDEFWPFHPDVLYGGMPFPVAADDYYPKLVRMFERVETELGLPVVVAAHPKSYYERLPQYFGHREILRGRTCRLVRDASLVLAHDSAALNFAVLYRKPTVFLACALHPAWQGRIDVAHWASLFGKVRIDLDDLPAKIDWSLQLRVDEQVYAAYQEDYIKEAGSPAKPAWEIFAEFVSTSQSRQSPNSGRPR